MIDNLQRLGITNGNLACHGSGVEPIGSNQCLPCICFYRHCLQRMNSHGWDYRILSLYSKQFLSVNLWKYLKKYKIYWSKKDHLVFNMAKKM